MFWSYMLMQNGAHLSKELSIYFAGFHSYIGKQVASQ